MNDYFPAHEQKGDRSFFFPLSAADGTSQWWGDLGIFPAPPEVLPLHHIPHITFPIVHEMPALSWYGFGQPLHPHHYPQTTFAIRPLAYATPNPSLPPDRPAPPMPITFVDGLGYTVNGDALGSGDCKVAWERVQKVCGAGGGIKFHSCV